MSVYCLHLQAVTIVPKLCDFHAVVTRCDLSCERVVYIDDICVYFECLCKYVLLCVCRGEEPAWRQWSGQVKCQQ